jgi:hypothetical protein
MSWFFRLREGLGVARYADDLAFDIAIEKAFGIPIGTVSGKVLGIGLGRRDENIFWIIDAFWIDFILDYGVYSWGIAFRNSCSTS